MSIPPLSTAAARSHRKPTPPRLSRPRRWRNADDASPQQIVARCLNIRGDGGNWIEAKGVPLLHATRLALQKVPAYLFPEIDPKRSLGRTFHDVSSLNQDLRLPNFRSHAFWPQATKSATSLHVSRVNAAPQPPEPSTADAELVANMARGNRQALGTLYQRHYPLIARVARRLLAEASSGEDLTQDVFLEAWRRARNYTAERGSVRSWLLVITRSRALDRLKSQKTHASKLATVAPLPSTLNAEAAEAVEQSRLQQHLRTVPQAQLEVLVLGYFEGMSSSEIATELDIPIGTVKSRTRAALSYLRGQMGTSE